MVDVHDRRDDAARTRRVYHHRSPIFVNVLLRVGKPVAQQQRAISQCVGKFVPERAGVRGPQTDDQTREIVAGPPPSQQVDRETDDGGCDNGVVEPENPARIT